MSPNTAAALFYLHTLTVVSVAVMAYLRPRLETELRRRQVPEQNPAAASGNALAIAFASRRNRPRSLPATLPAMLPPADTTHRFRRTLSLAAIIAEHRASKVARTAP